MSLKRVANGQRVEVVATNAEGILLGKLASLGIVPGAEITVLHNSLHGAFVISCRGSRFVIGHGIADTIQVH